MDPAMSGENVNVAPDMAPVPEYSAPDDESESAGSGDNDSSRSGGGAPRGNGNNGNSGNSGNNRRRGKKGRGPQQIKGPKHDPDAPKILINDLSRMTMPELREMAEDLGLKKEDLIPLKKQEIIFQVLTTHIEKGGVIYAYGSLEILPDGYGFLRSPSELLSAGYG